MSEAERVLVLPKILEYDISTEISNPKLKSIVSRIIAFVEVSIS